MKKILCCVLMASFILLCACSQQPQAKEVDLSTLMGSLAADYGFSEGMLDLTQDDLMELYGVDAADVKQFAAKIRLESIQADEVILIEAVDAQAAKRVKEKIDSRYQTKLNETRGYLPAEFEKIEKCKVDVYGNFISMIVLENASEAVTAYEKAIK